jgi:hypothetical protein
MFERLGQPLGHKSPTSSNFRAPTYDRFLVLALPGSNPRVQKKTCGQLQHSQETGRLRCRRKTRVFDFSLLELQTLQFVLDFSRKLSENSQKRETKNPCFSPAPQPARFLTVLQLPASFFLDTRVRTRQCENQKAVISRGSEV